MILMKGETVIITWARGGSSLSAIRSLGKRGIRIVAIDSIKSSPGFYSKFTDKAILFMERSSDLNAYEYSLKRIFDRERCLTVFPMDEITAYVLSKHKHEFEEKRNIEMPWPEYEQLKIAQDREKLLKLAADLGMPIPRCCTIQRVERGELDGPWVIKPGYSMIEDGKKAIVGHVKYASKIKDLKMVVKMMKIQGLNPIIQEFIPGEGYGFFALYNKGKIKASFQHHRLREASYMGGGSSLRESIKIPELQKEGLKIPQKLNWQGPIMVEFRKDQRDGRFKLMEVNPRFWGSLNLAIQSGVDFPHLFFQLAMNGNCESVFDYKVGVKCKNFEWEVSHLASFLKKSALLPATFKTNFLKSLFSILSSEFIFKDDYLSTSDLRPFAYELVHLATELARVIREEKHACN
jgi:predicted ATP-grasp superfamily ATP-dependent carboligase